jgi:hypothetical protein
MSKQQKKLMYVLRLHVQYTPLLSGNRCTAENMYSEGSPQLSAWITNQLNLQKSSTTTTVGNISSTKQSSAAHKKKYAHMKSYNGVLISHFGNINPEWPNQPEPKAMYTSDLYFLFDPNDIYNQQELRFAARCWACDTSRVLYQRTAGCNRIPIGSLNKLPSGVGVPAQNIIELNLVEPCLDNTIKGSLVITYTWQVTNNDGWLSDELESLSQLEKHPSYVIPLFKSNPALEVNTLFENRVAQTELDEEHIFFGKHAILKAKSDIVTYVHCLEYKVFFKLSGWCFAMLELPTISNENTYFEQCLTIQCVRFGYNPELLHAAWAQQNSAANSSAHTLSPELRTHVLNAIRVTILALTHMALAFMYVDDRVNKSKNSTNAEVEDCEQFLTYVYQAGDCEDLNSTVFHFAHMLRNIAAPKLPLTKMAHEIIKCYVPVLTHGAVTSKSLNAHMGQLKQDNVISHIFTVFVPTLFFCNQYIEHTAVRSVEPLPSQRNIISTYTAHIETSGAQQSTESFQGNTYVRNILSSHAQRLPHWHDELPIAMGEATGFLEPLQAPASYYYTKNGFDSSKDIHLTQEITQALAKERQANVNYEYLSHLKHTYGGMPIAKHSGWAESNCYSEQTTTNAEWIASKNHQGAPIDLSSFYKMLVSGWINEPDLLPGQHVVIFMDPLDSTYGTYFGDVIDKNSASFKLMGGQTLTTKEDLQRVASELASLEPLPEILPICGAPQITGKLSAEDVPHSPLLLAQINEIEMYMEMLSGNSKASTRNNDAHVFAFFLLPLHSIKIIALRELIKAMFANKDITSFDYAIRPCGCTTINCDQNNFLAVLDLKLYK